MTYVSAKFDVAHPMVKEKMHSQENTLFDLGQGQGQIMYFLVNASSP